MFKLLFEINNELIEIGVADNFMESYLAMETMIRGGYIQKEKPTSVFIKCGETIDYYELFNLYGGVNRFYTKYTHSDFRV